MSNVPIGTHGVAWGDLEKAKWLNLQNVQRQYKDEILLKLETIKTRDIFDVEQYGSLSGTDRYPLFAIKTRTWI